MNIINPKLKYKKNIYKDTKKFESANLRNPLCK